MEEKRRSGAALCTNRDIAPFSVSCVLDDFGGKARQTRYAVAALAEALAAHGGAAHNSLQQWIERFRKTCGQDWLRPSARLDRLARQWGVEHDPARPEIILFIMQSWYVLLVKLLVSHVMSTVRGTSSPLVAAIGDSRSVVESLESGLTFSILSATDPWPGEPFGWLAAAWSPALQRAVVNSAARIAEYDPVVIMKHAADGGDLLKPLYESLFPRSVRHALGEYYTPNWLAEHVLDQVGYFGQDKARLLDPTCGSGTFLLAAIRRWRQGGGNASGVVGREDAPCSSIVGFDLHPLAVASARANYLLAIADLIGPKTPVEAPIYARDTILDPWPEEPSFDFIVGNPPWIAWDNLPCDYREATKPLWRHYGLFSLSGNDARHGGGKKDLSMLVLYASADRYLHNGGRLGMVITQTLFQSKGAGDGFRRFQIGAEGPPLRVLRVDDLVAVRPFGDAANWTAVLVIQKGDPTVYPVTYVKWNPCEIGEALPQAPKLDMKAQPIDARRPTTPWIVSRANSTVDPRRIVGPSDYTAHLGANSGGANAVYWLEVQGRGDDRGVRVRNLAAKAKRVAERVETVIEPDLLYPLIRWLDINRWSARPSGYLLLAQDAATRTGLEEKRFRRDYPLTFAYLKRYEPLLTARAAYRRYQGRQPFYSMYNVGQYTLSSAKVIWRRMDRKIRAAVVEPIDDPHLGSRPVIPQETCVLIACASGDEAHYLCALLNSSPVHDLVAAHSVAGGKGFGTPSILNYLPLRTFNPADGRHLSLAALSRRLHSVAAAEAVDDLDLRQLDDLAANVINRACIL